MAQEEPKKGQHGNDRGEDGNSLGYAGSLRPDAEEKNEVKDGEKDEKGNHCLCRAHSDYSLKGKKEKIINFFCNFLNFFYFINFTNNNPLLTPSTAVSEASRSLSSSGTKGFELS